MSDFMVISKIVPIDSTEANQAIVTFDNLHGLRYYFDNTMEDERQKLFKKGTIIGSKLLQREVKNEG